MRLSDVPPWPEDEPLLSFASRVARCHGTELATFCHEVGVPARALADGREEASERLADLTGLDPASLAERAFRRDGHAWRFKGEKLHRVGMRRATLSVCPRCLREDVAGSLLRPDRASYVRAHWLLKAVRTCVAHDVALVDVVEPEPPVGRTMDDLARRLEPTLAEVGRLADDARPRTATSLERYVVERMHSRGGGGGLADAMPLHAAVRTCEMLGVAILFGPGTRTRPLDGDDWRAAGAAGFDVASLGARVTSEALTALMAQRGGTGRYAGGTKAFGRLYGWLRTEDSGPDYEPFREILREVVFETLPLAAGRAVLGAALDRRRVHSLRSAGEATGRGLKGLRRDLGVAGLLPSEKDGAIGRHGAMRVKETEATLAGLARSLPRAEAAGRVGATVADLAALAKAGLLTPLLPRSSCRSHVRYSASALDDFVSELEGWVTGVTALGSRMRAIPVAARSSNTSLTAITSMLLDGRLRNVTRSAGAKGFRSVLVDVEEVLGLSVTDSGRASMERTSRRHDASGTQHLPVRTDDR